MQRRKSDVIVVWRITITGMSNWYFIPANTFYKVPDIDNCEKSWSIRKLNRVCAVAIEIKVVKEQLLQTNYDTVKHNVNIKDLLWKMWFKGARYKWFYAFEDKLISEEDFEKWENRLD